MVLKIIILIIITMILTGGCTRQITTIIIPTNDIFPNELCPENYTRTICNECGCRTIKPFTPFCDIALNESWMCSRCFYNSTFEGESGSADEPELKRNPNIKYYDLNFTKPIRNFTIGGE